MVIMILYEMVYAAKVLRPPTPSSLVTCIHVHVYCLLQNEG